MNQFDFGPVREEISADVIVVGGGPAGMCAAIAAAREGVRVVLVEQGGSCWAIFDQSMIDGVADVREYGELDTTWKIASCIVRAREQSPITTTSQLVEAVRPCTPKRDESKFLTKLFQALRIEVNGEMEALKMALEQSLKVLRPGGRLVVISYHSLEDRLVKNFMRSGNFEGKVQQDFFGRSEVPFEVVSRKAVVPTDEEIARNPRSRSAKLRIAVKL